MAERKDVPHWVKRLYYEAFLCHDFYMLALEEAERIAVDNCVEVLEDIFKSWGNDRESEIFWLRARDGKSFPEIAKEVGCSSTRAQQIYNRILLKLDSNTGYYTRLVTGYKDREDDLYKLQLSKKTYRALLKNGIKTIAEVQELGDLRRASYIGPEREKEIIDAMHKLGLKMG